ncbi:MAG: XRE family transcriptional regulator [Proteobacteria bacterium]|nr:XRE family transcriptional regulator [Pseudomonadota bacterium]
MTQGAAKDFDGIYAQLTADAGARDRVLGRRAAIASASFIRAARTEANKTLAGLAAETGISEDHLKKLEKAEEIADVLTLMKVAQACGGRQLRLVFV